MVRFLFTTTMLLVACGAPSKPNAPAEVDAGTSVIETSADAGTEAEPPPDAGAPTASPSSENDPQRALATAKKDGKPTLLVFCAQWVAACGELAHVLADSGIKKTLDERFVFARVDVSNEDDPTTKERMKQYKVKGLPFMVVFDRKGKEVGRESGYLDSSKLAKLLDRAK